MRGTAEATRVVSRDGTEIAYWTSGEGPPLLLVHGTTGDHSRWVPLLPHLEAHATVHAMDRRGRGASGDAPEYSVEREFEDVAAIVDSVAADSGSAVDVYGHSYGAMCALGGATLSANMRKLVLYEGIIGPCSHSLPPGLGERMDELLARGDNAAVVEQMFRELLGMTDKEMESFKAAPSWPARVAAAPTIPREQRTEFEGALEWDRISKVAVPTLLLSGEESPDWVRAETQLVVEALPDASVVVLEGQGHVADVLVPEVFAAHMISFLRGA